MPSSGQVPAPTGSAVAIVVAGSMLMDLPFDVGMRRAGLSA
jgi:hypothetical protein